MPIALGLYFILPWRKAKNVWLLVVSLVFYAWGEPVYVLLMLASIVGNWLFALGMGDRSDARCLEKNAAGGVLHRKRVRTPARRRCSSRPSSLTSAS